MQTSSKVTYFQVPRIRTWTIFEGLGCEHLWEGLGNRYLGGGALNDWYK